MGVDYLICNYCGETFSDCGLYVECNGCGRHRCDGECAELDGWRIDKEENHECEERNSCSYCRNENYDDSVLLNKALKILNMKRTELIKKINEEFDGE